MKNELNDAWAKRVKDDNAAIKEIADRFYGGETELSDGARVALSLRERAKMHGCYVAASWEYDHSMFFGEIVKHEENSGHFGHGDHRAACSGHFRLQQQHHLR